MELLNSAEGKKPSEILQSKWNSRLSVWQFKLLPISVRFYDICEHLWNICEQKGDFGD